MNSRHTPHTLALTIALAIVACFIVTGVPGAALAMPPSPALIKRMAADPALKTRVVTTRERARAAGVDSPPLVTYGPRGRMVPNTGFAGSQQNGLVGSSPTLRATASVGQPFHVLVLLVDFSDMHASVSAASFDNLLFQDVTGPQSVRGYYREVSAGALDIQPVAGDLPSTIGWLRMPQPYSYYVGAGQGTGTYPHNSQKLLEDAVAAADAAGLDLSNYDNDGDGVADGIFLVHAGSGAEFSGRSTDIWSHSWFAHGSTYYDGVMLGPYTTEPEYWRAPGDITTGVFCHELGHVFGLPDLYDTDYSSQGLGSWSLMAGGSWNGSLGNSPARFDAWSLARLGFATPVTAHSAAETIYAATTSAEGTIVRIAKRGSSGTEYFLVENRQKRGTDSDLPGSGLLIYHVDETRVDNDTETHYLVGLEEAHGGTQHLHKATSNAGDAGDPFPGSSDKTSFSDTTDPSAAYFTGPSGILVNHIGSSSATMTAFMTDDLVAPVTTSDALASYSGTATVSLAATDTGSGVAYTHWLLDSVAGSGTVVVVGQYGAHSLQFWSADLAGNVESATAVGFFVNDIDPPTASSNATASYGHTAAIRIAGSDAANGSGVASVSYRLDGAATQTVSGQTATATTSAVGEHSLAYWSTDVAGNHSAVANAEFTVFADLVPPVTTGDVLSTYDGTATVSLDATDSGSGVAATHFTLDGVEGSGTLVVAPSFGAHALTFWSVDLAGNAETPTVADFYVNDIDPPTVSSDISGSYPVTATIGLVAHDATTGSGIASLSFTVDGAATTTVPADTASLDVTGTGSHSIAFWATDVSGNVSPVSARSFVIFNATRVVLAKSSVTVTAGVPVLVAGALDPATAGAPLLGQHVRLQRLSGATWVSAGVGDASASSGGAFAFAVTAWQNTTYRAVVAPGGTLLPGASSPIQVRVRAILSTPRVPSRVYRYRYFTASGTVKPAHASKVQVIWYRVSSTGHRSRYSAKTLTVSSAGKWSMRKKLPRGRWAVRVLHSDATHAASSSSYRTFRVR